MTGEMFCKKTSSRRNISPGNFKTAWPQKDSQTGTHLDSASNMMHHLN